MIPIDQSASEISGAFFGTRSENYIVLRNMIIADVEFRMRANDERIKKMEGVIKASKEMMRVDPSILNDKLGAAYAIKHYCKIKEALKELDGTR